jgi:hypothetical protein
MSLELGAGNLTEGTQSMRPPAGRGKGACRVRPHA